MCIWSVQSEIRVSCKRAGKLRVIECVLHEESSWMFALVMPQVMPCLPLKVPWLLVLHDCFSKCLCLCSQTSINRCYACQHPCVFKHRHRLCNIIWLSVDLRDAIGRKRRVRRETHGQSCGSVDSTPDMYMSRWLMGSRVMSRSCTLSLSLKLLSVSTVLYINKGLKSPKIYKKRRETCGQVIFIADSQPCWIYMIISTRVYSI